MTYIYRDTWWLEITSRLCHVVNFLQVYKSLCCLVLIVQLDQVSYEYEYDFNLKICEDSTKVRAKGMQRE